MYFKLQTESQRLYYFSMLLLCILNQVLGLTGLDRVKRLRLRGYGEFGQDRLELLAAGFLTPLHHLVQKWRVGLGHDDSSHRRRSGQLSQQHKVSEQCYRVSHSDWLNSTMVISIFILKADVIKKTLTVFTRDTETNVSLCVCYGMFS